MAKSTVKNVSKFDPEKNYKWDPEDVFEISGQQFASIYHALNQTVNSPGGAPIALIYEAYQVMMEVFKKGVEAEVIIENSDMKESMIKDDKIHDLFAKQ